MKLFSGNSSLKSCEVAIFLCSEDIVGTVLDYPALMDYNDTITLLDCRHAMCDHDGGSTFHRPIKRLLDNFLALLIKGGRRLVQDQDLWVLDKCSCNGDALFLTTREFASL